MDGIAEGSPAKKVPIYQEDHTRAWEERTFFAKEMVVIFPKMARSGSTTR